MNVNVTIPSLYIPPPQTNGAEASRAAGQAAPQTPAAQSAEDFFGPAVVAQISPEGKAAYEADAENRAKDGGEGQGQDAGKECQTCKSRKYVDGSDDASVSFQSPTHIAPGNAPSAVASHEGEHVAHEQAKAAANDRKVVSQSVSIKTSVCPECGRVYVAGGETRTVTKADSKPQPQQPKNDTAQPAA